MDERYFLGISCGGAEFAENFSAANHTNKDEQIRRQLPFLSRKLHE